LLIANVMILIDTSAHNSHRYPSRRSFPIEMQMGSSGHGSD
jgi:hypothetical protein